MLHDSAQKVRLLKLVSGEEIIGEFKSISGENGKYVPVIKHPLMLILIKDQKNDSRADVTFVPWMMGIDLLSTELTLSPASIMTVTEPNINLLSKYVGAMAQFKSNTQQKKEETNATTQDNEESVQDNSTPEEN